MYNVLKSDKLEIPHLKTIFNTKASTAVAFLIWNKDFICKVCHK